MLREIANAFNCEMTLELCHFKYLMRVNLGVMAKFRTQTGQDLQQLGIKAIRAYDAARQAGSYWARQEMLAAAVDPAHAAWLFYLAAHETNSMVEFEEFQDAMVHMAIEKPLGDDGEFTPSYAVLFTDLMTLVLCGTQEDVKKNLAPPPNDSGPS